MTDLHGDGTLFGIVCSETRVCQSQTLLLYEQWPRYECGVGTDSTLKRQLSEDPSVRDYF